MVTLINNDFNINITDPLISNSIPIINIPKKLIFKKEKIIIDREISSLG